MERVVGVVADSVANSLLSTTGMAQHHLGVGRKVDRVDPVPHGAAERPQRAINRDQVVVPGSPEQVGVVARDCRRIG
jgi:hypothetical protein